MKYVLRGFATVRRLGIGSFLCLVVAWYLLFSGLGLYGEVTREKAQPCELTVSGETVTDLTVSDIRLLDGVKDASKTVRMDTQILTEDEKVLALALYAVDADYLDGEILSGEKYANGTIMPYLLINEKCLNRFTDRNGRLIRVDTERLQGSMVTMNGFSAEVSGILRDDQEESRGYICIEAWDQMMLTDSQIPVYDTMWVRLDNYGVQEQVVQKLAVKGLTATASSTQAQTGFWEQRTAQARVIFVCTGLLLIAGAMLIAVYTRLDLVHRRSEYLFFRYHGAGKIQINMIFVSRIIFLVVFSLGLAAVAYCVRKMNM